MSMVDNGLYDEKAIKDAEKRTERYKSSKHREEISRFIKSNIFKDLDFPPDEEELTNEIEEF